MNDFKYIIGLFGFLIVFICGVHGLLFLNLSWSGLIPYSSNKEFLPLLFICLIGTIMVLFGWRGIDVDIE
jgi:hypothetical protein